MKTTEARARENVRKGTAVSATPEGPGPCRERRRPRGCSPERASRCGLARGAGRGLCRKALEGSCEGLGWEGI